MGRRGLEHDFTSSLAYSHAAEDLPLWEQVYRRAFWNFQGMHNHRQDGDHQRLGVDRTVVLSNGKCIAIDEKVRDVDYGDILLEYWSNEERRVPGWVCKPLLCDFIAYAVKPAGKCFLLPVPALQLAWQIHGDEWRTKWKRIEAVNRVGAGHYTTVSVGVPIKVLFPAIGSALRIDFDPIKEAVA